MKPLVKFKKVESISEIQSFISAWEVVFQRRLSEKVYDWIFCKRNNIFCAFDNEHVAAGYCLMNSEISIDNKKYSAVLCNNVFMNGYVYQKAGIFKEITEFALNEVRNLGSAFALGFPNQRAINAHLRAGWNQGRDIPFYEIRENVAVHGDSGSQIIWYSDRNKNVYRDISEFSEKIYSLYSFSCLRHRDFLYWRFMDNPRWEYDVACIYKEGVLQGFFISKYFSERARVHLVDYFFGKSIDLRFAISAIYERYEKEKGVNVDCIDGWCDQGDEKIFYDAGFSKGSEFTYVIYKDLQGDGLNLGSGGHFTLADNDVF